MSRPDDDIKAEFGGEDKLTTPLNIANHNATDDIHTFVRQRMASITKQKKIAEWPDDTIRQLADRGNGLFIWAETACKFIAGGLSPDKRLEQILQLSRSTAKSHPLAGLDNLYSTAVQAGIGNNDEDNRRHVVRCIGSIIATSAMSGLEQLLSGQIKPGVLRSVVESLGSVVYEDGGAGGPVRVFHPSFEDYITDPNCSSEFFVDLTKQNTTLAVCCLDTMLQGLKFDLCNLETSHVFNRTIPDLAERVQNTIAQHFTVGSRAACPECSRHLALWRRGSDASSDGAEPKFGADGSSPTRSPGAASPSVAQALA
ncbi:hypothetical protein FRC10_007790 [Ceratobasidium sp. 414]|nr:hypothetical protein FRC10_007790 [Ceratobasidium sp. 414]